jgi:hypothetical protein
VWLPGSQARAEPGHKDELNWTDRWQDPTRSWLLRGDKKDGCGSCPGLVLLSWWSPLQPGEVEPYLEWSIWFPGHLSLEGTRPYLDLLDCNRRPTVPGV